MSRNAGAGADPDRPDADPDLAAAALAIRAGARMSVPGVAIMAGVLLFVDRWFAPRVARPDLLDLWVGWMAGICVFWVLALGLFWLRRPSDAETVRVWPWPGRLMQLGFNLGLAASGWILLPAAPPGLQAVIMMLYVWYVAVLTITSNAGVRMSRLEILLLTSSPALAVLVHGGAYAVALAALTAVIGLTMLGLRALAERAVVAATRAQAASARSEAATREALAVVAAERDAKTRFIAVASHDLQQPIAAARLLFERVVAEVPDEERERATAGVRAGFASTEALLDSMLEYLRLEAGTRPASARPLDLRDLLATVVVQHEPGATAAGMRLRLAAARLHVTADPLLIERAVGNLLANAVRHSCGRRAVVAARARDGRVEVWVVDDGCGIDPDDAARLFGDFATGSGPSAGLGLGLASARRQAELLGGTLHLRRRRRPGAAFCLSFPLAPASASAPRPRAPALA